MSDAPRAVTSFGNLVADLAANRFLRFLVVGGLNTAFNYGIYAGLVWLGLHHVAAATVSFCVGMAFNFRTHSKLVFGDTGRGFWVYVASWIAIWLLNVGTLHLLVVSGMDRYLAGLVLIPPTVVVAFFVMRYIVFPAARPR